MINLKKITILILTDSSKSPYIDRCIQYHQDLGCKIIIIDTSKKILNINHNNVKVIQCSKKDLYQRLKFGVSKINSKYLLWLGDDDFLIKKTFFKCLKLLNKKKYNMIQGQYSKFYEKNFRLEDYNSNYFFYNLKNYNKFQNTKYAIENFYYSFKTFNPHAILNKVLFEQSIDFFLKHKNFKPFAYFDKIMSIFFLIKGKSHLINDLYQLRSFGTGLWQNKENYVKDKNSYFFSSNIYNLLYELEKNTYLKRMISKKLSTQSWMKFISNVKDLAIEEKHSHEKQTLIGNLFISIKKKFYKFDHSKISNYKKHLVEIESIKFKVNN